jgi:hypothetical protein
MLIVRSSDGTESEAPRVDADESLRGLLSVAAYDDRQ